MKTIIAGSRSIEDYGCLLKAIKDSNINVTTVISGGAKGVDKLGERYGKENNINVTLFLAEWDKYGNSAGYKRNVLMVENADAVIALWDGKSKGTKHMIDIAKSKNLKIYLCLIRGDK